MVRFREELLGLINAKLTEHFPGGAPVVLLEFSLQSSAGDSQFLAHHPDGDGVLNSFGEKGHRPTEQGVINGQVIR